VTVQIYSEKSDGRNRMGIRNLSGTTAQRIEAKKTARVNYIWIMEEAKTREGTALAVREVALIQTCAFCFRGGIGWRDSMFRNRSGRVSGMDPLKGKRGE